MKRLRFCVATVCLVSAAAGCLDLGRSSGGNRLAAALPDPNDVALALPADPAPNALRIGETATYYNESVQTTNRVNGSVNGLLTALEQMAALDPYEATRDRAVWGPVTPEGGPTTSMLVIERVNAHELTFEYLIRPAGSDDPADFRALVSGTSYPSEEGERGPGVFVLDWTHLSAVDPDFEFAGRMVVNYNAADGDFRSVEVSYEDFRSVAEGARFDDPINVTYRYLRYLEGGGEFQFAFAGDAHTDDPSRPAEETYQVRTRWDITGAGRADVRISGEEIAAELREAGHEAEAIQISECWDEGFVRTWFLRSPGGSGELAVEAEACPFDTSLYADDDINLF